MAEEITVEDLIEEGTLDEAFKQLDGDRSSSKSRAEESAGLTIPSLMLPDGSDASTSLPIPNQSLGARAVNNLASKLLVALLPPNSPFFKLMADFETIQQLIAGGEQKFLEFEGAIANAERLIHNEIEKQAIRIPVFEAIKHLIAVGNALLYKLPEKGMKVFTFGQYVISRDYEGSALDLIIKESVNPKTLDPAITEGLELEDDKMDIDIYTRVYRVGKDKWVSYQEIEEEIVEGSETTFNLDTMPYIALRWSAIDGEDYGRGLVEQYLGDLRKLDKLSKVIVDSAGIAAKTIFGIKPGSSLTPKQLGDMENGGFVSGDLERELSVLRVEKGSDMRVPLEMMTMLERRISQAFLLNSSVARESERTTATEIRFMASELEDALGGVYSVLAQELQQPLVRMVMAPMKKVLALPDGVEPSIVTGLEALSREKDLQKLQVFTQLIQSLSPELVAQYLNFDAYITKIAISLGLETTGLVKTQEQRQEEAQQENERQMQLIQAQQQAQGGGEAPQGQPQG